MPPALLRGVAIVAYALGASVAFDDVALLLALVLGVGLLGLGGRVHLPTATPHFRLELRDRDGVRVVGAADDEASGRALLRAEVSPLHAACASRQLVLGNVSTKQPITWQVVDPCGEEERRWVGTSKPGDAAAVAPVGVAAPPPAPGGHDGHPHPRRPAGDRRGVVRALVDPPALGGVMDDPPPETDAAARYDRAMLHVIITLVAGMRRGGVLLDGLPAVLADPPWRAAAIAEFGSWRTVLETLPLEAPPGYAGVHARLVRWAGGVGLAGEAYAAAIAARSGPQLQQASRQMEELPALYAAMEEALRRLDEPSPA